MAKTLTKESHLWNNNAILMQTVLLNKILIIQPQNVLGLLMPGEEVVYNIILKDIKMRKFGA
jgi:hypothetical protein